MRRIPGTILRAIVALALAAGAAEATTTLVPQGSAWKYRDDGAFPGASWTSPGFVDSAWASGPAQLGYGDGDEATVVSYGPSPTAKYTTTYFRRSFPVTGAAGFVRADLRLLRDDGAIVYLNGTEVFRSNLPAGPVASTTFASSAISGTGETTFLTASVNPALLVEGTNVLAVEIHQSDAASSDVSFDLALTAATSEINVTRGPYLQSGAESEMTVRWRTDLATDGLVRFGTTLGNLNQSAAGGSVTTEHVVRIAGLAPDTKYYYSVGNGAEAISGDDATHFFRTSPVTGTPKATRVWVMGDFGTADANANAVRNAFVNHTASRGQELWLMLGDNAYDDGTDLEYQTAVFDVYPGILRNTVVWPTLGNHDGHTADSATETGPYYSIFTLPRQGEAGGVASGSEAYYSFDYGNIHFVCLDSYETSRLPGSAMLTWLEDDLAGTNADWTIAFWHHPPYSKGSHDSDTSTELVQMRANVLPILEAYGVDLVLAGHSHSYERSFLVDQHYGTSGTLQPWMILDGGNGRVSGDGAYAKPSLGPVPHEGAVYVVAGSGGSVSSAALNHPVMVVSLARLGSMVIDVDGQTLDAKFVSSTGAVDDSFRIAKGPLCGNGQREAGEACDGTDLGGATCSSQGCTSGAPACTASCQLDYSGCGGCGGPCDGDLVCEAGEDCGNCPSDCAAGTSAGATCGNGVCEAGNGEDCLSCAADCNGVQGGKPSSRFCCGDGAGVNPVGCADSRCAAGGKSCTTTPVAPSPFCCGDATCSPGEGCSTCALDCAGPVEICGNGLDDNCSGLADCADGVCSATPACLCRPSGQSCSASSECCSGNCRTKGKQAGTCA
jgi:hypothetical protein